MSRKVCPIQDICQNFSLGENENNHWHRTHMPCTSFLDMSCAMCLDIQMFLGDSLSCDLEKIRRVKRQSLEI